MSQQPSAPWSCVRAFKSRDGAMVAGTDGLSVCSRNDAANTRHPPGLETTIDGDVRTRREQPKQGRGDSLRPGRERSRAGKCAYGTRWKDMRVGTRSIWLAAYYSKSPGDTLRVRGQQRWRRERWTAKASDSSRAARLSDGLVLRAKRVAFGIVRGEDTACACANAQGPRAATRTAVDERNEGCSSRRTQRRAPRKERLLANMSTRSAAIERRARRDRHPDGPELQPGQR